MLPNVCGRERTKREIVYYSLLLVAASLALYPLHVMGAFYFAAAAVLGGVFLLDAVRTWREQIGYAAARSRLFRYSLALPRADVRGNGDRPDRLVTRPLWTLSLGVFAGALDLSVLSPALPAIGRHFGVETGDFAWVFTIYLLVTVVSIAIASTLGRPIRTAARSISRASRSSPWAASLRSQRRTNDLARGARDSGARRRRHLPGSDRRNRRRRAGRPSWRRTRHGRRNVGLAAVIGPPSAA